ncbi:MAG: Fic family protein [Acidobacteriota bacterium]
MDSPLSWPSLTVERILELHHRGIVDHGGDPHLAQGRSCIEAALGSAGSAVSYLEPADRLTWHLYAAAHLLMYLVQRHCFVDGNKRVAWNTAYDVLTDANIRIEATEDDAYDLVIGVVTGDRDRHAVVTWFASRIVRTRR